MTIHALNIAISTDQPTIRHFQVLCAITEKSHQNYTHDNRKKIQIDIQHRPVLDRRRVFPSALLCPPTSVSTPAQEQLARSSCCQWERWFRAALSDRSWHDLLLRQAVCTYTVNFISRHFTRRAAHTAVCTYTVNFISRHFTRQAAHTAAAATLCLKTEPTLASCSFDKHGLISLNRFIWLKVNY